MLSRLGDSLFFMDFTTESTSSLSCGGFGSTGHCGSGIKFFQIRDSWKLATARPSLRLPSFEQSFSEVRRLLKWAMELLFSTGSPFIASCTVVAAGSLGASITLALAVLPYLKPRLLTLVHWCLIRVDALGC